MSEVHPISFPIHSDVDESAWLASQSSPVRDHAFPNVTEPYRPSGMSAPSMAPGMAGASSPAGAISDAPPPPTIDPEKERLALAELGHQTAAFTEAAEQLVHAKMNVFREAEGQLARLAVSIASVILERELNSDPSLHESLARAALDTLGDVHGAELVASEAAHEVLLEALESPFIEVGGVRVPLRCDPSLLGLGCIARSETSQVDGRLEQRLAEVARAFEQEARRNEEEEESE